MKMKDTFSEKRIVTISKVVRAMRSKDRDCSPYYQDHDDDDPMNGERIPKEILVERMGLSSWEDIKKRLNRQRPLDRDFVIALFSQLQLGVKTTNYALNAAGFPILCPEYQKIKQNRDKLLIQLLEISREDLMSIDKINDCLERHGLDPLFIRGRKESKEPNPWIILDIQPKVNIESRSRFSNSIGLRYDIELFPIDAFAVVKNTEDNTIHKFRIANNRYFYYQLDDGSSYKEFKRKEEITPVLVPLFEDLENIIFSEKKRVSNQFDDTKNYAQRISTKLIDGKMHIFGERFDFTIPELGEYFFVDYCEGIYEYSVLKKSQFLHYQIANKKYKSLFGKYIPQIQCVSKNIEVVHTYLKRNFEELLSETIKNKRVNSFDSLIDEVNSFKNNFKNNKISIIDLDELFEPEDISHRVCCYYKVDDKYAFSLIEENGPIEIFAPGLSEALFLYNGDEVMLTLDDLISSFSYGIETIDDICLIKQKYGGLSKLVDSL